MVNHLGSRKIKAIVGLLIVLLACSRRQQESNDQVQVQSPTEQNLVLNSGLSFERGLNRGSGYTDSIGTDYSLRYTPITIANDSTIPIRVELAFSKEYDFPAVYGDKNYKIIPLPQEWAQNGSTDSMMKSMFDKLPNYINKPFLNLNLEPGEKIDVAIGTLVPKPRNISINLNAPFAHTDGGIYLTCDWQMKEDPSSNREIALGLKLDINEVCVIIPCGKITYPDL